MKKITALLMLGLIIGSLVSGQAPSLPLTPKREAIDKAAGIGVPPGTYEMTAADIEAFLDGVVPLQLQREDIAGATIAIVKDGKVLFEKGYGFADVAAKKPVIPTATMFRPGSISKLFTWTAVMQQAEQGKLDLDRDINDYLDFKIPDAFGKPITLKDIMTHTAGFEEQVKDLFAAGNESPVLGDYVKTHIPARIFPPGTTPAYSNYATALTGYIVERVSGVPFTTYIEENIFKPLGMTHSTFVQPLPAEMAPNMSKGYRLGSDEPQPFEMVTAFPAGSLSTTADDISRFMLAHLQDGEFNGGRILKPETTLLMHSRLFSLDPAANAMCYGFYEESRNGHRIIGHGGDTILFHSDLHLIPDSGLGFFVSYNSAGKGTSSPRTILWEAFLDRYFPYTPRDTPVLETAAQDAAAVSGNYKSSRRSETSFLKVASVISQLTVAAMADGTIEAAGLNEPNGKPKRWKEVAPLIFREVNGQDSLIFKRDDDGTMKLILAYPFMVFERVGISHNGKVLVPVIVISLLIMLVTLLLTPIAWMVRRHFDRKLEITPLERWLRISTWIVFAFDLIFIVGMTGLVIYGLSHIEIFSDSGNIWFHLVQVIGVIGAIGTLAVLANAVYAWINGRNRIWGKLQATILAVACIGFLWFAFVANLLTFSSTY